MDTGISIVQGITLAVALLGAILGVINTWHGLDKARVKLRVVPKHAIPVGMDESLTFCIEVVNTGAFAVTIDDVGVFYKGTKSRGCITQPVIIDGGAWPRRLEPRSSVTVYSQNPAKSTQGRRIKCAYARTSCGYTKTGNTPALRQIAQNAL